MYRIFLIFTGYDLLILSELTSKVPTNIGEVQHLFPKVDDLGSVDTVLVTNGIELHILCKNEDWVI